MEERKKAELKAAQEAAEAGDPSVCLTITVKPQLVCFERAVEWTIGPMNGPNEWTNGWTNEWTIGPMNGPSDK